jgi:hypothetical protein
MSELQLLDSVLLKLGLAQDDAQLEAFVKIYLCPVLLKTGEFCLWYIRTSQYLFCRRVNAFPTLPRCNANPLSQLSLSLFGRCLNVAVPSSYSSPMHAAAMVPTQASLQDTAC